MFLREQVLAFIPDRLINNLNTGHFDLRIFRTEPRILCH